MSDKLDIIAEKIDNLLSVLDKLKTRNLELETKNLDLRTKLAELEKEYNNLCLEDADRSDLVKSKLQSVLERLNELEQIGQ